jgi:hypothetical protein
MRRTPENLFDNADAGAVAEPANAGAHPLAWDRERHGDHLTAVTGDAVAGRVQVVDEQFAAT